jgi:hypothetical protein
MASCLCQKVFSNIHNADEPSFEQHFSTVQKEFVKTESLSADLKQFYIMVYGFNVKNTVLFSSCMIHTFLLTT